MNLAPRFFLHLTGEQAACLQQAHTLSRAYTTLWITQADLSNLPDRPELSPVSQKNRRVLPANKVRTVLGSTVTVVVFDAFSGFDVNALAAASGTIHAGGGLILLSPPLSVWPRYADPDYQRFLPWPYQKEQRHSGFLQYLIEQLARLTLPPQPVRKAIKMINSQGIAQEQGQFLQLNLPDQLVSRSFSPAPVDKPAYETANHEQQAVYQRLVKNYLARDTKKTQNPPSVCVLTAARGRGKSTLLGWVSQCLQQAGIRIVLTAPSRQAVVEIAKHLPLKGIFYAPDELLQQPPAADLLIVDEAAAIPLSLLEDLLALYPGCILASTTHGYEGSGRGFVLRFTQMLQQRFPGWQSLQLTQPMRWRSGDPLETFLNEWLLLETQLPALPEGITAKQSLAWQYQKVSSAELCHNSGLLKQVFALLVTAHYQTRPADWRQLLDAPNISVHIIRQQTALLAVALLSREGQLDKILTDAIQQGKRRPHGHLIPQSLTFHAGVPGAACLSCERIMRIAVHPHHQRQGLGRYLLAELEQYARSTMTDYLGVSYADTPDLRGFWEQAGFVAARLGMRKDKASGCYSIIKIKGLTAAGHSLQQVCQDKFRLQSEARA